MNQCVPNWNLDPNPDPSRPNFVAPQSNSSNYMSTHMPPSSSNYEVAELTWENGQLAMHGLRPPGVINKSIILDKPRATGTLESIVNPHPNSVADTNNVIMNMDAFVPSCQRNDINHVNSTRSGVAALLDGGVRINAHMGISGCSTSMASAGNASSGKKHIMTRTTYTDDHDSFCYSRSQLRKEVCDEEGKGKGITKSSTSTKRNRATDVHNQSERKRRDKINERMKTLQKLVPNSSKTDKASMLDEVIEHLKQLQAQIQMMARMNMSHMMLPLAIQQQLQMSMMGMGMGVMDMNAINRATQMTGMPPVVSPGAAFMPLAPWNNTGGDPLPTPAPTMPDLLSTFMAYQSQPTASDAHNKLADLYQQFQQNPGPNPKN